MDPVTFVSLIGVALGKAYAAFKAAGNKSPTVAPSSQPQLNVVINNGCMVPISPQASGMYTVDTAAARRPSSQSPSLVVGFRPGDHEAEVRLRDDDSALVLIQNAEHPEFDSIVLTERVGGKCHVQLAPGFHDIYALAVRGPASQLVGYGRESKLRLIPGDQLDLTLPIFTEGVGEVEEKLLGQAAHQAALVALNGTVAPITDRVLIGRASDCQVAIENPDVSRHHAELRRIDAGHYEVCDLGSTNGTFINGDRVTRGRAGHDDEIRVGPVPLLLVLG